MFRNRCMDVGMPVMPAMEMPKHMPMEEHPSKMPDEMGMPAMNCCSPMMPGMVCPPVYECPQERCVNRQIVHEVPHVVPVNTRIINHHVYKHSFTPCFTCCEENVCSNVFEPRCGC